MTAHVFPLDFPCNSLLFMRSVTVPNQLSTNTKITADYKVSVFMRLKIEGDGVRSELDGDKPHLFLSYAVLAPADQSMRYQRTKMPLRVTMIQWTSAQAWCEPSISSGQSHSL